VIKVYEVKKNKISVAVKSVQMGAETALCGLEDVHFDLWTSLYGFV